MEDFVPEGVRLARRLSRAALGSNSSSGASSAGLRGRWEGVRAAKEIATATGCGFAIFAATDVLAQTLETQQVRPAGEDESRGLSMTEKASAGC